jgi:hypothetical protein
MKLSNVLEWFGFPAVAVLAVLALLAPVAPSAAQGVTTGTISGIVLSADQPVAGAAIIAIHLPSGTTYEARSRNDGRFAIPGVRVGGPYSVTATFEGGAGTAFQPETQDDVMVNLGVSSDLTFNVRAIAVAETVTVTATVDPVFSSARTGASTSVSRDVIAELPTISARISDVTRLTPQSSGNAFAGQDNRLNNITVDGSYFNSPFGLGEGQPGGRTGVAPISLESIEQVQVSIAPFDVRLGNFVGASVNTVTRSGTNRLSGSFYHRIRNEDFVGTEARGLTVNPGTFKFRDTGFWAGGPIIKNRLFLFGNYENELSDAPLHTFVANRGEPVGGAVTRVPAAELDALSSYLQQKFNYTTGGYENLPASTPAKRYLLRADFNLNNSNKLSFRYNQLDSTGGKTLSGSGSAGLGRSTFTNNHLFFDSSRYVQLENIKSGIGEWNSILGQTMSNSLIGGYTTNNENRDDIQLFPFVDILHPSDGSAYISFGSEPFTPNNELLYNTYQVQNNFTKFGTNHSLTVGGTVQRYEALNSFFNCCKQGAYVYSSLQDFYTDANDYLSNPNRTQSPVVVRRYNLRYMNIPGLEKPLQELRVTYGGGWIQDEWRPARNVTVTGGLRFDISQFGNTGYANPNADALTFRDESGSPVHYSSGDLPEPKLLWSPRVGFNWDVAGTQRTQIRGGTGVFTGPPLYVWISNQLGNTGMLQGSLVEDNTRNRPFHPDPLHYAPTNVTGAPASSYELNVTDNDFKFPQNWRTNLAVDHRLPGGVTATGEFIYNKDVNGIYYINANLPAPQSAFSGGPDTRPRWVGPSCTVASTAPCATRINNAPGNQVTSAIVMKNQNVGRSWNVSGSLLKTLYHGFSVRGAYSYGEARNTIDPGSTAGSSWSLNPTPGDPNNPGLGRAGSAQGHRVFVQASYTKEYFGFGATTIAAFWDARPSLNGQAFATNAGYVFSGDVNGDTGTSNDLIYIPRDRSEMNFAPITSTAGAVLFTAAQQADAFEAFIQQDDYLRAHRGEYAERGGVWYPMVKRLDLSITQRLFRNIGGHRNGGEFRIDFSNFGNLLNSNWGVSQRSTLALTQGNGLPLLNSAGVGANGQPLYRLAVINNQLISQSFQPNTSTSPNVAGPDVYQFMLSFRYSFN